MSCVRNGQIWVLIRISYVRVTGEGMIMVTVMVRLKKVILRVTLFGLWLYGYAFGFG